MGTSLVNIVATIFCVVVTVICFMRLATAAIATACVGDALGEPGGCNDAAITEAAQSFDTTRVYQYVGGQVTGLPSGFFYKPR